MKSLIGASFVVAVLAVAGPAAISPAAAASQLKAQRAGSSNATDLRAHRHAGRSHRHHAYHRPHYRPHYYDRPVYYRPYPYAVAAPFTFGIAFDPPW